MKVSLFGRNIAAALIALTPTVALRRFLLRSLLSYEIDPTAYIGFLNFISVKSFKIGQGSRVGPLNFFKGPCDIVIGSNSIVGKQNVFHCSDSVGDPKFKHMNYTPALILGDKVLVNDRHFFDLYGQVSIGKGSWVAGIESQFWTHGLSVMDRDITIGEGNYIGTAVRFAPGSGIGDNNVVGLSSVITRKIEATYSLISGFPAVPVKNIEADFLSGKYRFTFDDWSHSEGRSGRDS